MANSFVRYTGNGTTTTYAIPFSYRDTADLSATVAGVNITAYTLDAAGTNLTFTTAPANGSAIEIRRTTSQTTKLVDYVSGSVLTENDLDTDSDQAFFMSQEAIDDANDVISLDNADFQWDTQNKRLKNVADPTSAQDAATKNYLENTWLTPANKTALTTVNANIANINAVNSNASNINSAVSNATNINTVATNIGSVNTVATDIAKVITVANDLAEAVSEVETVADDLNETSSEIDTVAGAITNVNNVGNNIANVNTVAGISSNVTTVAGNNSNVSTVAGISGDVTAVANISSDVQAVENVKANVTTVAGIASDVTGVANISTAVSNVNSNLSNINAVNSNASNINTVAGNNSNISTVAGVSSDVTTVAGISSDVQAVENIASNVTTVAGMSTAINTVNSNATNVNAVGGAIANVNNVGGSIASVNTAASNLTSINSFANTYLGASGSAPTQDPDGSALDLGDLYFDTGSNQLKVYSSTGWVNAGSSVNGTSDRFKYTVSGTPTTISGNDDNSKSLSYDAGFIDVFLNGIKMVNGTDVTVTSGNSVVFASALTNGDVVDIITFGTFNIASMNASNLTSGTVPDARITGAYTGITNLTMSGDLTVDTNTLKVDSTNNRVGIGNSSPTGALDVKSSTQPQLKVATASATAERNAGFLVTANNSATAGSRYLKLSLDADGGDGSGTDNLTITKTGGSGDATITNESNANIVFGTNNTERMRLTSTGLGIGTSSPASELEIESATPEIRIDATSGAGRNYKVHSDGNELYIEGIGSSGSLKIGEDGNYGVNIDLGSGTVGIGETSPLGLLHVKSADSGASANSGHNQVIAENSGNSGMTILSGTSSNGAICFGDSGNNCIGYINYAHNGNHLDFGVNGSERMRIDSSGNVGIGNSGPNYTLEIGNAFSGRGASINLNNNVGQIRTRASLTDTQTHHAFVNPNGTVGTIKTNASATSFNTSSDYRLKENVSYDFDATTRLKQLKPARFNFIADADTTVDGFLAHEVSSVVPEAISGEKDAVDADGNPEYQGIDQSKLVPLLVKTIQELEARITTLENN
jgi:hypothetical protein